jgi:uncharacterized protein YcbX
VETSGHVAELRRYPVKSLVGERLDTAQIGARGLVGDRRWAVRDGDGKLGSGKTTRRFRRMDGLLELSAAYDGDVPVVVFPDGRRLRGDEEAVHHALTAYVGAPVRLAREADVSHFDEGPVHLVTTATLAAVAAAHGRPVVSGRLRPNVVVDTGPATGLVEDAWIGRRVSLGDEVELEVRCGMTRCVMVELAQVTLPRERGLLRTIVGLNDTRLGVVCDVVRGGAVRVGARVEVGTA